VGHELSPVKGGKNMERICENVYSETQFLGCNPGFVTTAGGVVMIDTPQKPSEAYAWRKEIAGYGPVVYLINTDHHMDHSLGNFFFEGDLVLHEGTAQRLQAPDRLEYSKNWLKYVEPPFEWLAEHYFIKRPKLTFTGKMTIDLCGEIFQLTHIHGHTEDETIVYLPNRKVLFSGDNVCTLGIPTLRESYPLQWLEALDMMETLDFDVLVPGHGSIGDKQSLRHFRKDLCALFEEIEHAISRGLSREDAIEEITYEDRVHAEYPKSEIFAKNVKLSIGRVYDTLKEYRK